MNNNENKTKIIYGHKNYTELEVGNVNILISVPHNGTLRPNNIQNRDSDQFGNIKADSNTKRLGISLKNDLKNLFLTRRNQIAVPFMILNNLHRVKMDPNRNPSESCANYSDDSHIAYADYHSMIEKHFKNEFILKEPRHFSQALILDLHGHSHAEDWIELGYLIKRTQLNKFYLDHQNLKTSINNLISTSAFDVEELLRGNRSLGGLLANKFNLKVVPSPQYKHPLDSNYFSGGYITEKHGSSESNFYPFNSIQIEVPSSLRSEESVDFFARKLADAIYDFYFIHSFDLIS